MVAPAPNPSVNDWTVDSMPIPLVRPPTNAPRTNERTTLMRSKLNINITATAAITAFIVTLYFHTLNY